MLLLDCKSKAVERSKAADESKSTDGKVSTDEKRDVYLASTSTQSEHDAWLIDSVHLTT